MAGQGHQDLVLEHRVLAVALRKFGQSGAIDACRTTGRKFVQIAGHGRPAMLQFRVFSLQALRKAIEGFAFLWDSLGARDQWPEFPLFFAMVGQYVAFEEPG